MARKASSERRFFLLGTPSRPRAGRGGARHRARRRRRNSQHARVFSATLAAFASLALTLTGTAAVIPAFADNGDDVPTTQAPVRTLTVRSVALAPDSVEVPSFAFEATSSIADSVWGDDFTLEPGSENSAELQGELQADEEVVIGANTPDGWTLEGIVCDGTAEYSVDASSLTIPAGEGDLTCTFTSSFDEVEPGAGAPADDPADGSPAAQPRAGVTPLADSSSMTVIVRKRTFANPTSLTGNINSTIGTDHRNTVGTVFRLHEYSSYSGGPGDPTDYTCEITDGGQCAITVPNANGANQGKRFWVVEETPSTGTYSNDLLLVGDYNGPTYERHIVGVTKPVSPNTTITMPMTANTSNGGTTLTTGELGGTGLTVANSASFGAVANSLENPDLVPKCAADPLRVALVLDQSASISTNSWSTFRSALTGNGGVLSILRDAEALVSILGFGSDVSSPNGWHRGATGPSVLPTGSLASLIPSTRPGGSGNATNWDAALSEIQRVNSQHQYDLVLFITDGAPNYVFSPAAQPSSANVTLRSIEAPIYAANAIKDDGTRVVAVGVGAGITGAGPNLRAISGETLGSDYYQTSNWNGLKEELANIAKEATCQIPIEVSKTAISNTGTTTTHAADWNFSAAATGAGATLQGTATQTTTAGSDGDAKWTLVFSEPTGQSADLTLSETLVDGWNLESVACTVGENPREVTIVDGSVTLTGLTTTSGKVVCTFTNEEAPQFQDLTISKTANPEYVETYDWDIEKKVKAADGSWVDSRRFEVPATQGSQGADYRVTVTPSGPVYSAFKVTGAITVKNPNDAAISGVNVSDSMSTSGADCEVTGGTSVTVPARANSVDGELVLMYECNLPDTTAISSVITNTATATWNADDYNGTTGTATTTADANFGEATVQTTNKTVTLTDDENSDLSELLDAKNGPQTFTYKLNWPVAPNECVDHDNIANIKNSDSINESDYATVTVCGELSDLTINKTAAMSYSVDYDWMISKDVWGAQHRDVPATDDTATFTYDVVVTPSAPIYSDFAITGEITVTNSNPVPLTDVSVTDALDGWTCEIDGTSTGVTVPANGSTETFDYSCTPTTEMMAPPASDPLNTATVTWDTTSALGTSGSATTSRSVSVAGAEVTTKNDKVTLTDSHYVFPDPPVVLDAKNGQEKFTYNLNWPVTPGKCVDHPNTATIAGGDINESDDEVVTICGITDLLVSKNVVLGFDRTYLWDIEKNADDTRVEANDDGEATFTYTVTATPKGSEDGAWVMNGMITLANPNAELDLDATVTDAVSLEGVVCTVAADGQVTVHAGGVPVDVAYSCTFPSDFTPGDYSGTNTATATWTSDVTPSQQATGTAEFTIDNWVETPINDEITVVDDQTRPDADPVELGPATWNSTGTATTFTYTLTQEGVEAGTCETYDNRAWIAGTAQEDTEEVTACRDAGITVEKTAETTFTRTYDWDITKAADSEWQFVDEATGEAIFSYEVQAIPGDFNDSDWGATGTIKVTNNNDYDSVTVSVADAMDNGGVCTITGQDSVTLAPKGEQGDTHVFDYTCEFDEKPGYEGTNTATVTVDGSDAVFTGEAEVVFDVPTTEIDKTVMVLDDKTDPANPVLLGTSTWGDESSYTHTYDLKLQGIGGECVEYLNTAWLKLEDGDGPEDTALVELCLDGDLALAKTVTAANQLADGTWLIVYEIDVTNNANFESVYNLTDTLDFGDGLTVTAAEWEGQGRDGDFAGDTATLATGESIDGGATHTYKVRVNADVAEGVTGTDAGICEAGEDGENGGFFNSALLTARGQEIPADACAEPASPEIEKTAGSASDNGDGTWTVDYTLTVTNPDTEARLAYDLEDAPDFAEGVSIVSATVEAATAATPAPNPDWDGVDDTVIVSGQLIAPGVTHEFTVSVVVDLQNLTNDEVRECAVDGDGAGHGLFNSATLTSGNDQFDDDDCAEVPEPQVDTSKGLTSVNQNTDGTWTVVYELTAHNTGSIGASATIDDALSYGSDITVVSATVTGPGANTAWDGQSDTSVATDVPLAGGDTLTYTVTVIAAVGANATVDARDCELVEGEEGTGFLNSATFNVSGEETTHTACGEPGAPVIEKTFDGLSASGDSWTASYTVSVTNPHDDVGLAYSLSDEFRFAGDVVIESVSVTPGAGAPAVNPDFDGIADTNLVTDEALPAGAIHTFVISAVLDLTQVTDDAVRECAVEDSTGGQGLFNEAMMVSGNDSYTDDACGDIPTPGFDVSKTALDAQQNADGTWTVTYEVGVENTSSVGGVYDLSDELAYGDGLTPIAATWERGSESGAWVDPAADPVTVLATNEPLPGGQTHTYEVTVTAELEPGAIGTEEAQCTGADGSAGGFLNKATVSAYGDESTAQDCLEPGIPTFEKLFGSAVQNADATWDVTFTLKVDNSGNDSRAFYDLEDSPGFADGVTILDQRVLDTSGGMSTPVAWNGTDPIVTGAQVDAGATHSYEVTFTVRVAADIPAENLTCDPESGEGSGFFNSALLTTGVDEIPGEDCGDITEGVVPDVAKTLIGTALNPDGTWTVEYEVRVSTPEANTLAATYSLADQLHYGQGITVLDSAVSAGPDTPAPVPTWTGLAPDTELTDGEVVLPAGVTHSYTVTVTAEVAAGVIGSEAGECHADTDYTAGGFLNVATLTTDDLTRQDTACGEPEAAPWTLQKDSDPASGSKVDPGSTITYTLTATPTGEHAPVQVVVTDDMSEVLNHAEAMGTPTASIGDVEWNGTDLVWTIGTLEEQATLTYSVKVNADARDVTLKNVATGTANTPPTCEGDCSTTHTTPPTPALPPVTPPTGVDITYGVLAAILLISAGAVVLVRRRSESGAL